MNKEENVEHRTSNIEHRTKAGERGNADGRSISAGRVFDLEERLLDYAARIVRLSGKLPRTRAGNHVAKQLLKSGTSPLPNHGEAQAAESRRDFIHKMRICLKELRETHRWLRLTHRAGLVRHATDLPELESVTAETLELTRIFVASIHTAERNLSAKSERPPQ